MNKKDDMPALHWHGRGRECPARAPRSLECPGHHPGGNRLVQGDNLEVMQALLDEGMAGTIDLVYMDPPFWSGGNYFTKGENDLAYEDTWKGDLNAYLSMMAPRLRLVSQLMASAASIFLHVDWHAGHYLKVLMDEVFGRENFRNEIIWHYGGPSPVKSSFPRKHDTILYYVKDKDTFTFTPQYNQIKPYLLKRARKDPDGRLWVDQNVGGITDRKFKELQSEGRVFKTKTGRYRRKQYIDEMAGDMVDDVWTIPIINSQATERLGYPTQKPEALLDRVLSCASRPGDLVADFFCGSGTTLAVAESLGRRWIGCDESPVAIETCRRRLEARNARYDECKLG